MEPVPVKNLKTLLSAGISGLVRAYRLCISPLLGDRCRFYPSCSTYLEEAVEAHGLIRGLVLAGKRICKCHPFHEGGFDYVPRRENSKLNADGR